ncbi:hypothetical protein J4Q44_G00166500 [Coregonus suidteri]|uniref:Uncharacterized protein n=1 Tax=Coregonus suidteri TaxID=861788 RepID=A0AAN8LIH6_9TELE
MWPTSSVFPSFKTSLIPWRAAFECILRPTRSPQVRENPPPRQGRTRRARGGGGGGGHSRRRLLRFSVMLMTPGTHRRGSGGVHHHQYSLHQHKRSLYCVLLCSCCLHHPSRCQPCAL